MAVAEELVVKIRADADKALKDLNAVEKQTGKAEGGFKKFTSFLKTTGVGSFLAVGAAIAATTKLINDSIKAYGIQEEAEASLANALKVTEQYSSSTMNALKDYAAELQNVTKYGDEATISAMAMLQQLGDLSEDGLMAITPLVQDFATAMGVDLNTAASLVGKTLSSSTNALARYGIEIDMTGDKEEKLAGLTKQLGDKFGGAAQAAADTASGAMVQYKNAVGDLQEAIGGVILEGAQPFLNVMKNVAAQVAESINKTREFKNVMEALEDGGMNTSDAMGDVEKSIQYVKEKLESLNRVNGVKNYAKIEQYEDELELLQTQYRNLAQLQYQEALREDAAEAAAKRIREQRELEQSAEERLQQILDSRLTTEEKQAILLQKEIDYWAEYREISGVQELLNELIEERNRLLNESNELLSGNAEHAGHAYDTAAKFSAKSTAATYTQADAERELHEARMEQLEEYQSKYESLYSTITSYMENYGSLLTDVAQGEKTLGEAAKEAAKESVSAILRALGERAIAQAAYYTALSLVPFGQANIPAAVAFGVAGSAAYAAAGAVTALADGGVVTKPTNALIGEAGPEAVIPLSKGGFGNTTVINIAGSMIMQDQVEAFIAGVNAKNNRGY